MTDREPFALWKHEFDFSWFTYVGGELHEVDSSQQGAEERCERINRAFEKAVAKRETEAFNAGIEQAAKVAEEWTDGDWQGCVTAQEIRGEKKPTGEGK